MFKQKIVNKADLQPERLKESPEKERRTLEDAPLISSEKDTGSDDCILAPKLASKPVLLIEACCTPPDNEGQRPTADVTGRSSQMPRGSCLLYPNKNQAGNDPAHNLGVLKSEDGTDYWCLQWPRTVNGRLVYEIRLVRKGVKP
jgi:hypothetical protein